MWLPEILTLWRDRLLIGLPLAENALVKAHCWTANTVYVGVNNETLQIYDGGPYVVIYPESVDPEEHPAGGGFINRNVKIGATAYYSNSCSENHAFEYETAFLLQLHRAMIQIMDYYNSQYMLVAPHVSNEVYPRLASAGGQVLIASTVIWEFQSGAGRKARRCPSSRI